MFRVVTNSLRKNCNLVLLSLTAVFCLSGADYAKAQVLSSTTVNMGNVVENQPSAVKAVTLKNTGTGAITVQTISVSPGVYSFDASTTCPTTGTLLLAQNASCKIGLILTPTSLGPQATGTLSVPISGNPTLTATLNGNGVTATTLSATTESFGNVVVNEPSAYKKFTLKNNQLTTTVGLSAPTLPPGGYAMDAGLTTCGTTLAPNSSCTYAIILTPASLGAITPGNFSINTTSPTQSLTVALSGTGITPTTLSATTLNLGNVVINEKSADKTFTLKNNQLTTTLGIGTPTLPPGGYAIDAGNTTCTSTLAPGANCTYAITLTPTALGPVAAGNLTIPTTSPSQSLTLPLSGTGIVPTTLSPAALSFGNVLVGLTSADKTLTLKNNQLKSLSILSKLPPPGGFVVDTGAANACGATLGAGLSCSIAVNFSPAVLGPTPAGNLVITTDASNSPLNVPVSGTGTQPITLSTSALSFPVTLVGDKSSLTLTVTNGLNKVVHFTPFPIAGSNPGDFSWTGTGATPCGVSIQPAASCSISVTFKPITSGARSALLQITDDTLTSPQVVTLKGDGNATVGVSPQSITNFTASVGTASKSTLVTITNNNTVASGDTITITSFQTKAGFLTTPVSCGPLPFVLEPSASCTVDVQFLPTVGGTTTGQLQINDTALTSPQVINLSGNGINPLAAVTNPVATTPPDLIYPAQPAGTISAAKSITLQNFESQSETFNLQVTGDYKVASNTCSGGTIAAQSTCIIAIEFTPPAALANGPDNGTLTITDSAPNGTPLSVALTGSVGIPEAAVAEVNPGVGGAGTSVPVKIIGNTYTHFSAGSVVTFADTDGFSASTITSFSVSGGVLTATANNGFTSGESIKITAKSGDKLFPLNNKSFTVLSTGLSDSQFEISESTVTGAGSSQATATAPIPPDITIDAANITSYSASGGVVTLTANNDFTAGESITIVAKSTDKLAALNGQTFQVSATGLSSTGFQIPYAGTITPAAGSSTASATTQVAVSANEIDATLVIAPSTTPNFAYGARNVTVNSPLTPSGTETAFLLSAFTIYDPTNTHIITMVNPGFGNQGQTENIGLSATGTNWQQGVTFFNFGTGITINSMQITDPTDAVVNITISNTTTVGPRTIVATTGGEYASNSDLTDYPQSAFQVNSNGASLVSVSPNTAPQGACVNSPTTCNAGQLTITGLGTHFLNSATTVSVTGGVIVGAVNVTSATTAVAQVIVPNTASVGPQTVTAATGGEIVSLNNGFTITGGIAPYLTSVIPSSGVQGQALTVDIKGANTAFNACSTGPTADFTGQISSPTVNVISATEVKVPISITQISPTGTITARLTCGGNIFAFPFTVNASNASIVSVTPNSVPQGAQVTLTLVGSNTIWNQPQTTAAFYPEPVVTPYVNEINVQSATGATLNITVPSDTPVGDYPFYLATGGQVVSASIHVYASTPTMTMSPANGVVPTPNTATGAPPPAPNVFSVTLNGQFTNWSVGCGAASSTVPVISGEGVTFSNFCVTSPVSATATVTILPGAATNQTSPYGPVCGYARLVTLTTGAEIDTTCFNVTATPVGIISITPPHAAQGVTVPVSIVGLNTHFCDNVTTACPAGVTPSTVLFGPEITVVPGTLSVADNTHLTVNITTSFNFNSNNLDTTPGYQTVYVNTGNEQVSGSEQVLGSFSVDPPQLPTIVSVVPDSAPQGSTENVTITGSLTNWCSFGPTCPSPTEGILGAGVTISNLTVTSPTTATATISVSPTAPIGGNSVTMITGTQVVGGTGFSVTPSAAYIASVEPNFTCPTVATHDVVGICSNGGGAPTGVPVVGQLQTVTLNVVGVGTHWLQGGTNISFGPGVVIDSLTVNSPTTATAQITVLSSAPIGFATATAYTDGEAASLQQAIDIESGFPTLLVISPSGGEQGATMNVEVLGRFTHWDNTSTVAFNQDITVNTVTVLDSQNLVANITVSPLAYVDFSYPCGHVLTITTPSANEQVSTAPILDNYCVSQGAEEITGISSLSGKQGSTQTVTITGSQTNFENGVTQVSFGDPNFQVGTVSVSGPTSLTVPISVSTAATPGFKNVTVTTLGQVASQQYAFTVIPTVAQLTEANPAQAEQGQQLYATPPATGIDVILTGQYSHFTSASTATFGAGIVVNNVTWNSATQLTANITIDPLSYPGGRSVTVTTPNVSCQYQPSVLSNGEYNTAPGVTYSGCTPGSSAGTGSEIVTANVFTIIPGPAIISNVSPNTGNEGQEVVYNITGTDTHWQQNFTQFYIAGGMGANGQCPAQPYAGGPDLQINSVIINSATSATVDMTICPYALAGARSIFMQTAGESLVNTGAFVVTGGIPVVAFISPGSGVQANASPIEFDIRGIDTLWAPGVTTVQFDPSLTASSVQVDDNLNIEGLLAISNTAQPGYHVFTVTTTGLPSGTQVLSGNFLVVAKPGNAGYQPPPAPYISYMYPTSGLAGQTFNITFTGQYTKWDPNPTTGTQCNVATGLQLNSCQVLSQTSILANITIPANTTPQSFQFTFTTPSNSNETEKAYFNVVAAVPSLTVVDPGSGMQGDQNLTVNVLGQYTLFDATTTLNFGSGITVNSIQVLGPTIAIANINIDALATLGGRSVIATTPDANGGTGQTVGGAGFSVTPNLARIASVTPNVAAQGQSVDVAVTGSNTLWDGTTVFSFGDGIVVSNTQVISNTSATLTLTIPAYAGEGPTWASAQTGGEIANLSNAFVVTAGTPYLLSSGPGSLPQQSSATFTILSQATNWTSANPPTVSYGAGVVVSNVQVTGPTSMTVQGSVMATTPVGYRNLTVTNGSQVLNLSNAFYVAPGPAVVNSVNPNTGGQGVNLPAVQITGINTNWCGTYNAVTCPSPTVLTFPGVLLNNYSVTSPTTIMANITPSDYAPAGQVSVTATTGGEVATGVNLFDITQTQPELLSVVPTNAPQGWTTQNVTLTADFTHFCDNSTTTCTAGFTPSVVNFGAGITVNSVTAQSATKIVANVTVQPTSNLGLRNVSVVTGSESVEINNAFTVTVGPAAISQLNPAQGGQNTTATIVVTGSQTHFNGNSANGPLTVASFGGGIIVTQITVTDIQHASVNITIPSGVALGNYNVTLTTGGEVATILGGFQVTNGSAIIQNVNPATGTQGITENVTLTGLYTHFCDNVGTACGTGYTPSMVSFGSTDIVVHSVTVTNSTSLVANIIISPTAAIASYTPKVTTGAEVAIETGGFSVLAGVPTLLSPLSPASAQAGTSANVIINGEFTTFQQGFSNVSFGSGITVNFVTVSSTTQLTANITVSSSAAVGNRTVTVTTNSQTESLTNGFAVTAGTPVITQINPNIGNPGQTNLSVTLTGQYTNWSTSTKVTMGTASSGISVGGQPAGSPGPVTTATATSVTFTISIASGAPLGPVEVTTTTGAEVEIVPGGFTVQAVTIPPPSVSLISPGLNVGGNMPINSSIIAVFSQPMKLSTINTTNITLQQYPTNGQQGYPYITGTVTLDATGRVMTFMPTSLLPVNSQFLFTMNGNIQDASGRAFPNYSTWIYTGYTANSSAPTVVLASPPANDNRVGTNASVQLQFSVPMSQGTETGMTVSTSGNPIAGTYTWNSDPGTGSWGPGNILTFVPSAPLTPNTTYTVAYSSALTDTAGNALTPGSFTFTTGPGADTANNGAGPDFTSGIGNMGTNFAPRMNYTKPVNPIDINAGNLYLYNTDSGKYIPGTVTVAPNGMSAVFTPLALLLPGTRYQLNQNGGYLDASGNYLNGNSGYFTTGNGEDQTAPSVQTVSPPDNATGVPLNAQLTVLFNEPIDYDSVPGSVTVTPSGGSAIPGSCSLASDQVTMTCVSTQFLLPGTTYTVQISGYKDVVGNTGTSKTTTFTTLGTAGSFAPIDLSTGLDANGNLITEGNTADAHWRVTPTTGEAIGVASVPSGSSQPLQVVAPGNAGWYSGWMGNGPESDWVNINPNSTTSNTFGVYWTQFTITGSVPSGLCLVGQAAADDNGTLSINGTVVTSNFSWQSFGFISIPVSSHLVVGTNTLSLDWGSTDNSYEAFRLQAVIAPCGEVYGSTTDSGGLTVVNESPANHATAVATNTSITFTFNNSMDLATVNSTTLPVMIGWNSNQEVAGTYTFSTTTVPNDTVTFVPDSPFPTNTTIYVGNCNGPYDLAGDALYAGCYPNQGWYYFTTGSAATPAGTPFQVTAFSPAANATGVGLRAPVTATFNRSLNLSTINSGDYALFAGDGQAPWCGGSNYLHSQDDATIQFNLNNCGAMPSSTLMTAQLGSGLSDWQGNGLVPYTSSFTTTYYDSNTYGSVTSTKPGNGATGVAANVPLVLYTNLPINPSTAASGIEVAENGTPLPGTAQVIDNGYALVFTPTGTLTPGALIQWWLTGSMMDTTYNVAFRGGDTSGYYYVAPNTGALTPTVQSMNPSNGSSGIPLNSFVDILFNTSLDPTTITSSNIYLSAAQTGCGGAITPVTYTAGLPANEVRMVPNSPLTAGDYYYVCVEPGLKSTTSVPAAQYQPYFYAGTTSDSTLPVIVSEVPFNGATNIGINDTPGFVFNKSMDPLSVNSNTFMVCNGACSPATQLAGSFWFNSNDTRLEFVPNTALPASTTLTMTLNGLLDPVGHSVSSTSNFTTGPGPDVTAPYVEWASVTNNGSLPVNAGIRVQFSESMDVTTFSTATSNSACGNFYIYDELSGDGIGCIPATLSWNSDQSIAYLVPSSPLAAGREYNFTISSGTDLAGNSLSPTISWTIYGDLEAPGATTVVALNPANGASNVGTNTQVEAEFSAPIDPTTISDVTLKKGSTVIAVTPVLGSGNTVLQLVPPAPLAAGATYTITVAGVKDTQGATVSTVTGSFTTGTTYDNTTLSLVSVSPANNSTVATNVTPQLKFNKPLNPVSVNTGDLALETVNPNVRIPITVSLSSDRTTVTLTPVNPLQPGTEYQFSNVTSNLQDEDGNSINLGWYYFWTTSGSNTSSATVTVNPVNNATNVPLNAQVIAFIGTQIDPTTVGQNAITLTAGGPPIAGTVTVVNSQEISFAPASNLAANTVYTVNVGNFTDVNGNAVTMSPATTFTTGSAAATTGLSLIQADDNPAYGATGVSATAPITLQFSQVLDPATVAGSLYVMNGWDSNQGLPGNWVINGNQATFTPSEPYPFGATIYVGNCGGPTDVLGEVLSGCFPTYLDLFTVVSGTPSSQVGTFKVLSVNPAPGATNVLTNTPVSVTFSNSVAHGSWNNNRNNIQLYAGQGVEWNGGNISISEDGRTLTFNGGALYPGTNYTLTMPAGGITDDWGNSLASTFSSTFTTTSDPDYNTGAAGSVIGTNPGNTSGISTATWLTLYLNRQVNPSTLPGNLVVTVNGVVYNGTVTSAADGYEVQYAPTTAFPNSADVQWWFSNAQDVNGVPFNGASGYFYTAAATTTSTMPTVVARSPENGDSTDVPTNAEFDIEYSLPLASTTVNSTNVTVYDNGGTLPPSAYSVSLVNGDTVRVQANPGPWVLNQWAYVCVSTNVTGTNTVPVQSTCYWTSNFYPTYGPDTSSGTVTIGPPNGSVNVGTNAYFRLNFSKPVDATTFNSTNVQVTQGGNPVAGSWSYTSTNITGASFSPTNPLLPNTQYKVSVSGLIDYAGNAFNSATSTITTGPMPVYNAPTVSFDFGGGTTGIATNASFNCHYNRPMDPTTFTSNGLFVYSYVTNSVVPATITYSSDWTTATITPTAPLYANSSYYYACYYALDLTGNAQSNNNVSFTTGSGPSTTGPSLVYANPPTGMTGVPLDTNQGPWNATSLDLLFNEPVSPTSLATITLTSQQQLPTLGPVVSVPVGAYLQDGDYIASIDLGSALLPNTLYTVNFAGVTDLNDNPATGTTTTSFTTGTALDYTNPVTASTVPVNNATGVSISGPFSITFNKAMNPTIVTPSQIYLRTHNTQVTVPGTVTISNNYQTITIIPNAPLQPSTIYDLMYWPNNWYLYDIAGNDAPNYGIQATFTTGAVSAINGVCGSANGGTFAMAPNGTSLCSAGTASSVTNNGSWNWNCNGQYGGTNISCSANVTAASCTPWPSSSLVSWWKGDDNANDLVGGNNGTLENGAGFGLGEVEDAFSLNGSNQYVLIGQPVPASLQIQNAITLSAWIYPTAYPTDYGSGALGMIVGSQDDGVHGGTTIFFDGRVNPDGMNGIPTGHIHFQIGDGTNWHSTDTETQLPLNQWTLITATRVANGPPIIYYNGVSQPLQTINYSDSIATWNGTISYPSSDWFAIGQEVNENRPFTGLIDEVQVYSQALTPTQIQAIYNAGYAGVCKTEPAAINGTCGSASGVSSSTPPTTNLCSAGTATYVSDSGGNWTWGCTGDFGGTSTNSCSAANTGVACATQPSGLIDWYRAEGNANDSVGGNNGTIEGTVTYATGQVGQAFSFGGSGDVSVPLPSLNTTSGQVTVSFWMKWNGANTQIPFGFQTYDLYLENGSFGFNTNSGDIWGISSSGFANTWVQVTAVFTNGDPHNNVLYINGVKQTLTQQFGTTPHSAFVTNAADIGKQYGYNGYNFNGLIDEVQIYNSALSTAQAQAIYSSGSVGVCH